MGKEFEREGTDHDADVHKTGDGLLERSRDAVALGRVRVRVAEDLEEALHGLGAIDDGYVETILEGGGGDEHADEDGA